MSNPESPNPIRPGCTEDVSVRDEIRLEATTDGVLTGIRDVDAEGRSFSADIPVHGAPLLRRELPSVRATAAFADEFRYSFCDLGTQYYVAARLAARARLLPVHGNLFHHAVEMYLKAALIDTLSLAEMASRAYGHDVVALWDRFKTKEADAALARFDAAIQALNEFDLIRYPEKIVNEGMIVTVVWQPEDVTTTSGSATTPPKYEFVIADIDNLVIEVLKRIPVSPKYFATDRTNAAARDALVYQNPQAASWLEVDPGSQVS